MLNHLSYQGRLVADPETRDTNSGTKVANYRVAWSEKYKEIERKCFLECKAFGALAEFVGKYFHKGQEIVVEGKLITEEWQTQDGQKRSKIVLNCSGAHFCGPKQDGAAQAEPEVPVNMTPVEVATDELPF